MAATSSKSAEIRAKLTHPIIDSDGHLIEVTPVLYDYIRAEGGEQVLERFKAQGGPHWTQVSLDQRDATARMTASTWWLVPTKNGLDRATAMIPRLLAERLDELRSGLLRALSLDGAALPEPRRRGASPGLLPGVQQVRRRNVRPLRAADDSRRR